MDGEPREERRRRVRDWRADADDLLAGARILRDEWLAGRGPSTLAFPALLLAGYAVEDCAKARLIELGKDAGDWLKHNRGHDLSWLVNAAGVGLAPHEAELLRRLEHIVQWSGRYPEPRPGRDREPGAQQVMDADFRHVEAICERLNPTRARPIPKRSGTYRTPGRAARRRKP